ncbi:MAG TPA: methyltransferase [Candidatus Butyricicoccus avistercoris]|uniref:Methyltransferase n=1 Tax=Candidatus Butyricicoccus avistercoris TaxID=2838518 RepID=A0A9D1PIJ8_9FIRM|nr:methyltransferase [Candidatus Butyricicoccus avistercoris]
MQSIENLPNGLDLIQDDDFFKLGQDSTLLSSFAKPRRFANVLDLGCGVGTLALLCWRDDLKITGLELQEGAIEIFSKSIEHNNLQNVKAIQGDLKYIRNYFSHGSMDYVICNPPYFKSGSGRVKALDAHALARMDGEATIEDVAVATSYVLKSGGKCAMVFRPERLITLITALERVRLTPKRLRFVHQTSEKAPSAVLIECRKGGSSDGLVVEPPLIVNNSDGTFTDEYLKIYNK